MIDLLDQLPKSLKTKLKEKEQPEWISPMLATLTEDYFSDANWIFERKFDGERCIILKDKEKVKLLSRNEKELTSTYPELARAFSKINSSFILDGEIVAFDGSNTSFSKLQNRMKIRNPDSGVIEETPVFIYLLDLLYLQEYDLTAIPLRERKKLLKSSLNYKDPIRYTAHINEEGESYHQEACKKGWEGIIGKKASSGYVHSRSKNWLKFKCVNQQEFVIVGFTDPEGERIGFGALLIGFYKNKQLQYAGKVGTGYDDEFLKSMRSKMDEIEIDAPAMGEKNLPEGENIHWLKPKLVGQFGFTEWTDDDKLRHPRFIGMRDDKKPEEVLKEEPQ